MDFPQTHLYLFLGSRLLIHKFAHHLCNIEIFISDQIVCMLLTLDTAGYHVTNVTYGIVLFLQCIASVVV